MFHLLTYTSTTAGAVTLQNLGMVSDGSIAQGSTGYRFTERYKVLAAFARGVALTQAEIRSSTLDGLARWNVYPVQLGLNIATNPQVDDYRDYTPVLPMMEDINFAVSDTQAGGEEIEGLVWVGTQNWTKDLAVLQSLARPGDPYVGRRIVINSTTTVPKGAKVWGADTVLTFEQTPRSGVYAVIGGQCVAAATLAWRLNFPSNPLYQGRRKLFPGDLTQQAFGDAPNRFGRTWMGVWGVFHTFELPFISLFGTAAGNIAINLALELVYLGGNDSPDAMLAATASALGNAA